MSRIIFIFGMLLALMSSDVYGQCNITVDAGPDQNICSPGGDVQLDGSVSGNYEITEWSPVIGISDINILNPTAVVTSTTTYTLTAVAIDPTATNLISNGDFEAGNTGFTSQYAYGDPNNSMSLFPEGVYTVTSSAANVHPNFAACPDHTSGAGNMMVINGAATANVNIWCQPITVTPNSYYNLRAWIASVISSAPAQLQFSINGTLVGSIFNASSITCNWELFDGLWFSGAETSVQLCITNQNTVPSGNDFAIDDISFTALCSMEDQVTIHIEPNPTLYLEETICPGDIYTLGTQSFENTGSYFDIEVIQADGCVQLYDLDLEVLEIIIDQFTIESITCSSPIAEITSQAFTNLGTLFYEWSTLNGNIISDPTQDFILVDQPGLYQITFTAEYNGVYCDSTIMFIEVIESGNLPTADAGPDGIIDCGNPTFDFNSSGSSQGSNFNYTWRDSLGNIISNSLDHSVNSAGNYSLTIEDISSGCMASDTARVRINGALPQINAGRDTILSCDVSGFLIQPTIINGQNLIVSWSTLGGNIVSINNITDVQINQTGLYILTATDLVANCTSIDTISVIFPENLPDPTFDPASMITCSIDTITLSAHYAGDHNTVNFSWSNIGGQYLITNDSTINVLDSGTYILTVTDPILNCTSSASIFISQNTNSPVSDAGPDGILDCANFTFLFISGGSSQGTNFNYTWRDSLGNIISNNLNHSVNSVGNYSLTIEDISSGCISSDTVRVIINETYPQINTGHDTILSCDISEFLIQPTIINGQNLLVNWSTLGGNIVSLNNIPNVQVNQTGLYILTATDNITSCTSIDTISVIFPEGLPDPTFDPPGIITCSMDMITLNAHYAGDDNAINFSWSNIGGQYLITNDSTINVLDSGTYILTVTDPILNCTSSASIFISQNTDSPVSDAGPDDFIFCDSTLQLDGSLSSTGATFNYNWSTINGNIINNPLSLNPEINQAGIYYLEVINTINGCNNIDSVLIQSNQALPDVNISLPDIINCNRTIITLIGSSPGTADPITYLWSTNDGNIIGSLDQNMINVDQIGTYTLQIKNTVTNCSNSESVPVYEDFLFPIIDAGTSQTISCTQSSITLMGQIQQNQPASILWTHQNGQIISGEQTLNPVINQPSMYYLTVTFNNGCQSIDSVEILIDQDIPIAIIEDPLLLDCRVDNQSLDASQSSQGAIFIATWQQSAGSFIDSSNKYMPIIDQAGVYILRITNIINNCTKSDTVNVLQDIDQPNIQIDHNDLNCIDTVSILDATGSTGSHELRYLWTGSMIDPLAADLPIIITANPGEYTLQITDIINGCTDIDQVTINSDYNTNNFIISIPPIYETFIGQEVRLNAEINFNADLITNLMWSNTSTLKNYLTLAPIACPTVDTKYLLNITINNNCDIIARTQVRLNTPDIYIPNVFTPNNDGTNDGFTIYGDDGVLQIDKMIILNRWGDIVFNRSAFPINQPNLGWDGLYKDQNQNTGIFMYYIEVRFSNNEVKRYNGDLTLLR